MAKTSKIRLQIVDDHPSMSWAFHSVIDKTRYEVTASATTIREALAQRETVHIDAIVLDLNFPDGRGESVLNFNRTKLPQPPVLVFTGSQDRERIQNCLKQGALGYLSKSAGPKDILEAIETVAYRRESYLCRSYSRSLETETTTVQPEALYDRNLTKREKEILAALARSLSNKEVAYLLGISTATVQMHRANIMRKLKLRGSAALTRLAFSMGLVQL